MFNEICSRRIADEYDFFGGLIQSPTFMWVIVITVGLQALIINFMGIFFSVRGVAGGPQHDLLIDGVMNDGVMSGDGCRSMLGRMQF